MSVNLLLEHTDDPVVWRGPVIAGTVKQFWSDVVWGAVDYMFVDMPPGTGDVPLTVFQSLPVDGIVIVTSPQDLVSMIVKKACKMAKLMNIPVVGIVENMSYRQEDRYLRPQQARGGRQRDRPGHFGPHADRPEAGRAVRRGQNRGNAGRVSGERSGQADRPAKPQIRGLVFSVPFEGASKGTRALCPRPFLMRFFALPLQLIEPVQPADPFFPEHSPEEGSLPSRQLVYQAGGDGGMLRLDPDAGSGGERR